MKREKKIIIVAHCLLNVNAKVEGIAMYPGAFDSLISRLMKKGFGIIQLPCPEILYYGVRRWGQVAEQMDIPLFHRHCIQILSPIQDQMQDYLKNGYQIVGIIGVDKSPSCGVNETCRSDQYQGEISSITCLESLQNSLVYKRGPGIFMRIFQDWVRQQGFDVPFFAIDELSPTLPADLERILS